MTSTLATGYALLSSPSGVENPLALLPQILSLVTECWKLDTRLATFYKRLEKSTSGPVYWARLSNGFNNSISIGENRDGDGDGDVGVVFPVAYQFEDLDIARTCTVYWATLAILWSGMKYIYSLLSPVAAFLPLIAPEASLPPLEHRSDTISLAKNICQSIEYITSQTPDGGSLVFVFPLKVAIETFADGTVVDESCARELEWAKSLIGRIARGVRLLSNLDGPVERHAYIPSPGKE
jgi:hypothetical protein